MNKHDPLLRHHSLLSQVEVLDAAKGPTALPCFFWFRRWLREEDGDGLVASAPMTTRPTFDEAQKELLDRRKRDVLGIHKYR